MNKYQQWIKDNVPTDPDEILSQCSEYVEKMSEVFPELTKVPGHVFLNLGYQRAHWWLTDAEGTIIDPTAHQYKGKYYGGIGAILSYEAWLGPLPTGTCPNCGGYCYDGDTCCSDRCGNAYASYLMSECRR